MTYAYITVGIPRCIEEMEGDLATFFDLMIEKLAKNAHKSTPSRDNVDRHIQHLLKEVVEFIDQNMEDPQDPNAVRELADIANFAFLTMLCLKGGKAHV